MTQEEPNPLMRKKKTPEELAAEAEAEEEDEITSTCLFAISHSRRMRSNLGREEVEANFLEISRPVNDYARHVRLNWRAQGMIDEGLTSVG